MHGKRIIELKNKKMIKCSNIRYCVKNPIIDISDKTIFPGKTKKHGCHTDYSHSFNKVE